MSASSAGAIKALLESAGLSIAVYRDQQPAQERLPYVTVLDAISVIPDPAFNQHDDDLGHVIEQAQVDLWERWRDENETFLASNELPDAIAQAFRGARFTDPPTQVIGIRLLQGPIRLPPDPQTRILHTTFLVEIRRTLTLEAS